MLATRLNKLNSTELSFHFRDLCLDISKLANKMGILILPFVTSRLPVFSALKPEQQRLTLQNLQIYHHICQATLNSGANLSESKSLIWQAIKTFGLRPTSDLFNYVEDNQVIEVHNAYGIQIFRNFEFYRFCSYSLEELYCVPWDKLFAHGPEVTQKIMEKGMLLMSGKINNVIALNLDPHEITEVSSPCKFHINSLMHYGAPLFDATTGAPAATIVLEVGKLLNPEKISILKDLHTQVVSPLSGPELI